MTDDIKELLKTIRGGNASNTLKVEIYTEIKKYIGTEPIEEEDLHTIIEDLDNSDSEIREAAWSVVNLCKITVKSNIFNGLIKLVSDKDVMFQRFQLWNLAKEKLISSLNDYIKAPDFSLEELLCKYHNETETITTLFIEMCKRFSKTETADILYYKLFPFIFHIESEKLRDSAIEIGMGITSFNTLADLDPEKHNDFLASIENEYIVSIRNVLGKMKHQNWHKMFILLLRYGGIIFHQRVDITNAILKIAEGGFKSSSIDNKLFAFDCWKELINNYSLNLKHMTMPKHIKLLVTPLKANLSSNEAVVHKRFEVWVHLLKKLEDKAVVCLEQFLNFCFGPLGANPLIAIDNPQIASPGKKVVRLCNKSPKFLLEVLGHYGHNSNDPCVNCEEELKLEKPIVNSSNFQTIYTPIIHSIGESCLMLSKWNTNAAELSKVIHCMWGSLLIFIKELQSDIKRKVLEVVSNQVLALSKVVEYDHIDTILMPIIYTIMNVECTNTDDSLLKPALVPSLKYINATGKLNTTRLRHSMDVAFSSKKNVTKVRMFGGFCDLITEIEKVKLSYPLWITLSHFVPDLCRTCPINEVFSGYLLKYMLWPVNNYNYIPDDEKQNLINTWKNLMDEVYKNSALVHKNHQNFQTSIVHSFQKIIKKKPLVINSVSLFLSLLSLDSLNNDPLDTLFISDLLQLILDLLDCPLTSKDNISKLAIILTVCINTVLRHPNEKADLIYEKLFKAIQYFLQPHQMYSVLDKLDYILSENYISKETVPHALRSLISDLTLHNDSEISQSAIKILSLLENTCTGDQLKSSSENFIENSNSLLSRSSAKKMVQKSTKPTFVENTRVIQQLLEKNTSPIRLKGSQLKNSPKSSKTSSSPFSPFSKKYSSRSDKNETYVLVENNYKFDKRKLTEHQKEKMKRRREDIPALYQDLTQSQTDSTSNSQEDVIGKDLKVIVKRMPSLENTNSLCHTQGNDLIDNINKNSNSTNSHLNENYKKENTSYGDMQQIELIINETNKTEQKSKEIILSQIPLNEDTALDMNLEETNNLDESPGTKKCNADKAKSIKRNKRMTNELLRLKMDIVGGDISINVNEQRKSRRNTKSFDKTNSPFVYQNEKIEYAETPKVKKNKIQKISKNFGTMKGKHVQTEINNSDNSIGKELPKRKYRKKRSQSLTHNNDKAHVIKNNLKRRSNSETKECTSNNSPSSNSRGLLKNQNSEYHSEDIIESSQDSYMSVGKSVSKTFCSSNQVTENTTTSTVGSFANGEVQPLYTGLIYMINYNDQQPDSPQSDKKNQPPNIAIRESDIVQGFREKTLYSPTIEIIELDDNEKVKETEKEQKSDTIAISEDFSPDKLIRKDLDQIERKLTKREIEIAEADTESPPMDNLDDFKVCSETLEASSVHTITIQEEEIVSCTKEEKDAIEPEEEEKTPSLFDSEANDQKDCEANVQHLEEDANIVDTGSKIKIVPQQEPPSRSARLVGLVTATNSVGEIFSPMNPFLKRKSDAISVKTASTIFSPKTSRVRKMMQNCEDQKPLFIIDLDEEVKDKIPENQLLQFNREVPSPLATPKGSILKRKRETNDYLSDESVQSTKRKRVNFSDPPTTCKKVFIQHQDELVHRHRGIKKKLLLTKKLLTKEIGTTTPAENGLITEIVIGDKYHKATNEEVSSESSFKEILEVDIEENCDIVVISDYTMEDNMEIESFKKSSFLDDVVPICPDLTDCLENVEVILNKLRSPLCKSALLEELNKENIHTIADLAFLTEKKVNSLSLESPKITEVKRALSEFKEDKKIKETNEVIDGDTEHVLDSNNLEKTISSENINVLESDLNTTTVMINGEPNEIKIDSDEHNSIKLSKKGIAILDNFLLRAADLKNEQNSTNQNQPDCSESKEQTKSCSHDSMIIDNKSSNNNNQSIIKENSCEPLQSLQVNEHTYFDEIESFIKETPLTETAEEKLKRLIGMIFDKLPASMVMKISHEYLIKRLFVSEDCKSKFLFNDKTN